MNLENLNLVELNAYEVENIDGGTTYIGPSPVLITNTCKEIVHALYDFTRGFLNL